MLIKNFDDVVLVLHRLPIDESFLCVWMYSRRRQKKKSSQKEEVGYIYVRFDDIWMYSRRKKNKKKSSQKEEVEYIYVRFDDMYIY